MSTINVGFQVLPFTKEDNMYELVDKAIEVVQESGVKYEVGPLETVMEGELDHLIDIVKKAQQACLDAGAESVITNVKIINVPKGTTIEDKIGKYRA
ncbi:thiamine-binding protein [Terrilactibacillus laevilacticus]|uniref:MTH1187 family thiamine-binding protein n=1 Tax=Terrilactibacillus laevilacticus TaxID=1380157 RepID=A0ABW5PQL2_9BACI|nr:thiamine-binding protein [Terrilactibacillus laevilacticus]